jgi:hypothetical protein
LASFVAKAKEERINQKKGNYEKSFNRPNGPLRRGFGRCGASSNLAGQQFLQFRVQEAEFLRQSGQQRD